MALATRAASQKSEGCTFAYINIPEVQVHYRFHPCFHGKSQINYLAAKENTSTFLYSSSYMTFFSVRFFFFPFSRCLHLSFLYCYSFHSQRYFKLNFPAIQFILSSTPAMGYLEKSFLDKSFPYCPATHQGKGLQQARLHLLAPLSWVAVWISAFATPQHFMFRCKKAAAAQ